MKLDNLSVDDLLALRGRVTKEMAKRATALRKEIEFIDKRRKRRGRKPKR